MICKERACQYTMADNYLKKKKKSIILYKSSYLQEILDQFWKLDFVFMVFQGLRQSVLYAE